MNALFTGIYSRFTALPANAFYTAVGGRLYLKKAPQAATFPYCVYSLVSDVEDHIFVTKFEDVLIQFAVYSRTASAAEAGTVMAACQALYDDCALTVVGYSNLYMTRELMVENDDLTQDPPVYGYVAQYRVSLQKS